MGSGRVWLYPTPCCLLPVVELFVVEAPVVPESPCHILVFFGLFLPIDLISPL